MHCVSLSDSLPLVVGGWTHEPFSGFFLHREEAKFADSLELAMATVAKLEQMTDDKLKEFADNLSTAFAEWSTAKGGDLTLPYPTLPHLLQ